MLDTGTESLPMVAIFMPFADVVCVGFDIAFPLRDLNTLSVVDNIVMIRSKERSKCGCGWSIVSGAM